MAGKGYPKNNYPMDDIVEFAVMCFRNGEFKTTIFKKVNTKWGVHYDHWQKQVMPLVKQKIKEETDIYTELEKEMQIVRLQELYNECKSKKQYANALKALTELNKVLEVGKEKIDINNKIIYELEI